MLHPLSFVPVIQIRIQLAFDRNYLFIGINMRAPAVSVSLLACAYESLCVRVRQTLRSADSLLSLSPHSQRLTRIITMTRRTAYKQKPRPPRTHVAHTNQAAFARTETSAESARIKSGGGSGSTLAGCIVTAESHQPCCW